jgi:predicted glycoside hydrolase/deacetylase ChbG (UPF0249 family)
MELSEVFCELLSTASLATESQAGSILIVKHYDSMLAAATLDKDNISSTLTFQMCSSNHFTQVAVARKQSDITDHHHFVHCCPAVSNFQFV